MGTIPEVTKTDKGLKAADEAWLNEVATVVGRPMYWTLNDDHTVRPATRREMTDLFSEKGNERRIVKQERVGRWFISTVFLVIDHNFGFKGDPVLFETMIFDESDKRVKRRKTKWGEIKTEYKWLEHYTERYRTWEEAEAGHAQAVKFATLESQKVES